MPAVALFLAAAAPYLASLDGPFVYDDVHAVAENPAIRSLANIPRFFADPASFSVLPEAKGVYRPVLLASFALDHAIGGSAPRGYKRTGALLHGLNVLLLYFLVLRLVGLAGPATGPDVAAGRTAAVAAAGLFATHPLFSETVCYVSARSSLLATTFILGALLAWSRRGRLSIPAEASRTKQTRPEKTAGPFSWLASGFLGLALLTKAIAVTLPLLFILLDVLARDGVRSWRDYFRREGAAAILRRYALPLAVVGGWLLLRRMLLGGAVSPAADAYDPADYLAAQLQVVGLRYPALFAWPAGLSPVHDVSTALGAASVAGGAMIVLAMVLGHAGFWWSRAAFPRLAGFSAAWYLITLAPTSSILPLKTIMNEHRLYLPGVGLCLLAGLGLARLAMRIPPKLRQSAGRLALAAGLLALLGLTAQRARDWADPVRLLTRAIEVAPASALPHNELGVLAEKAGRTAEAEARYRAALAIDPAQPFANNNLGTILNGRREFDAAEARFRKALDARPDFADALNNLGVCLFRKGDVDGARSRFEEALRLRPDFRDARDNLAILDKAAGGRKK